MAVKYLKAAGGNWSSASSWSSTGSGGVDNAGTPTAADNLILEAGSGNLTIDTTPVCRSLNCTSGTGDYTGTITHNAAQNVNIGDATAGTGSVAWKLSSACTYTLGNATTSALTFISTSATQQTITLAGKTMGNTTYNASSNGSWRYADTHATSGLITLTKGSLDWNGQTLSGTAFNSSNSNVRSLTAGAATATFSLAGEWWTTTTTTNGTFNMGTSTLKSTGLNASMRTNSFTFYNVEFNGGGAMVLNSGGNSATYNGVTVNGTASNVDTFSLGGNNGHTINGFFKPLGYNTINRLLVYSTSLGTQRTIVLGASATMKTAGANYVDFRDVGMSGGAANELDLSAVTSGDQQGNSGIIFTTSATQTRDSTNGQAWGVAARWTSRVPLPQDDVVFNSSSGSVSSTDVSCLGRDINFTGYTGTITRTSSNTPYTIFGSLTMGASMNTGTAPNTWYTELRGRLSTQTITNNGKFLDATSNSKFQVFAPGGTYTMQDAINARPSSDSFASQVGTDAGTLDFGSFSHTIGQLAEASTTYVRAVKGSGTLNFATTGTVTILNVNTTNLTFTDAANMTFNITGVTNNVRTFAGGGLTYGTFNYSNALSAGNIQFTGANTFNNFITASGRGIILPANTITTIINSSIAPGTNWQYMQMSDQSSPNGLISTPDASAIRVATGDITIDVKVSFPDWSAIPSSSALVCKLNSGLTAGYCLRLATNSAPTLFAAGSQGSAGANYSSVFTSPNQVGWVRVQRRASDGRTQFFYSSDGSTWTQLGSNVTIASGSGIGSTTDPLYLGSRTTANDRMSVGRFYQARIYDDLTASNLIFHANFETKPVGTDTMTDLSANAATITIGPNLVNGDGRTAITSSTSGTAAYISKPSNGPISIDYAYIKDIMSYQPLSIFAGTNSVNVSGNKGITFAAPRYTHQQSIAGAGTVSTGVPLTLTFPTATTPGSLLVAYVASNGSTGAITPPAGWTQATTRTQTTTGIMYYKVATGAETTVTYEQATSRAVTMEIVEYAGFTGTPTLDVTDGNDNVSAVTSLSTGAGVTNTAQPALALANVNASGNFGGLGGTSATNNFDIDAAMYIVNASPSMFGAVAQLNSLASITTTLSWANSRAPVSMLAIFKDVQANNGAQFFPFLTAA